MCFGIPWGCKMTRLPRIDEAEATAKIKAAVDAFGFRTEGGAGWRLVTVARGG